MARAQDREVSSSRADPLQRSIDPLVGISALRRVGPTANAARSTARLISASAVLPLLRSAAAVCSAAIGSSVCASSLLCLLLWSCVCAPDAIDQPARRS